jgi:hypothetical protein
MKLALALFTLGISLFSLCMMLVSLAAQRRGK